jgi:pyruvate-formate lyase-activating enzyme
VVVLTLTELEGIRHEPGRSCLVFLTDRCPVGCAHCSVESRPDSPRIVDQGLFRDVLAGVLSVPGLELIGVSGGEPFVERSALSHLVRECSRASRKVVLYTSGFWAANGKPPWVGEVLVGCSAVVLSMDAFHATAVGTEALDRVADMVLDAGCSLIVQTVDLPGSLEPALRFVERRRAAAPAGSVEINVVPPLRTGRGRTEFALLDTPPRQSLADWGACGLLTAPVVRYDGLVVACCNEAVLMGAGPDRLRRWCRTGADVAEAISTLRTDPLLECMRTAGTSAIARLPWVGDAPDGSYGSICEACWEVNARYEAAGEGGRRSVRALNALFGAAQAAPPPPGPREGAAR